MRVRLCNRVAKASVLCILSIALGACVSSRGLQPDGRTIDPSDLHSKRSFTGLSITPAAWPAQDWWITLGDAQLNVLIEEALRSNPNLAEADARARLAQAKADAMNAERGPNLNANASATGSALSRLAILPPQTSAFSWEKSASLNFSWGMDLWGGKRASWEAMLGRSRAAEIDARAARIALSVNIARAYAQLALAFAQRDIALADRARAHRVVELTYININSGLASAEQRHQVETEARTADQNVAQAEATIDSARASLSVLLGQGPDRGLEIARPGQLNSLALSVPENLPVSLLGRRPDLVAARWRVEADAHDIVATKAQFLPNISISAMAGLLVAGSTNLFQLPARTYSVEPAVSLPLFDGGYLRANLNAADAAYDEDVASYNASVVMAVNEVARLITSLKWINKRRLIQREVVNNAKAAWDDSLTSYRAGLGTELNNMTVRQQLLSAQQSMVSLDSEAIDTSVQLINALGGGFKSTSQEQSNNETVLH
ncbi:efflux transporter outer membrane subunit [Burkholderia cenocepacia]|uniref:efflux transporter outer membrane subunit n=1 Tax=Burkholderia cenocepacia TaxID=95486 RepID=UPI002AB7A8D0|nr:efflux transporter outer membrane subunit [Burkholderia cenocepacia]